MGAEFKCKCPKCGYSFYASLELGMPHPSVVEEETKKMKAGVYGDQGKRFFEEHPDGKITCYDVVIRCKSCGNLEVRKEFNLLVLYPAFIKAKRRVMEKIKAGDPDFNEGLIKWLDSMPVFLKYVLHESYNHFCSKCGSPAEIIEDFSELQHKRKIRCPECGKRLKEDRSILWD